MMEMSAELTAAVLENILRHGKFNIPTKNAMENAVRILKETPEVVRCKDCAYWKNEAERDKHPSWLPCMNVSTRADFFCADGVKE